MTAQEVFEQAKALTKYERKELAVLLIDSLDIESEEMESTQKAEHWGKAFSKFLDNMEPVELPYPEIEDPVEWVQKMRADRRRERLGDWGEE